MRTVPTLTIAGVPVAQETVEGTDLDGRGFASDVHSSRSLRIHFVPEVEGFAGRRWSYELPGYPTIEVNEDEDVFWAVDAGVQTNRLTTRLCLARLLEEEGGTVLHASSVMKNERAWLFMAKTGTGKSTLARNARATVLADDTVVIRGDDVGLAYGTPFTSHPGANGLGVAAPIAALCFLEQDESLRVERIGGAGAFERFLANVFSFPRADGIPRLLAQRAMDLLTRIPAFVLGVPLGYVFEPRDLGLEDGTGPFGSSQ